MSLILEALRKLDREKHTPEKGFVVLGSPVAADAGRRWLPVLAIVAALALSGAALALWLASGPPLPAQAGDPARDRVAPPGQAESPIAPALASPAPAGTAVEPALDSRPQPATSAVVLPAEAERPAAPSSLPAASGPVQTAAQSPAAPQQPPSELVLEAIALKDGHWVAVLSGRLVREGDVFGAVRVVRIGDSEVEIETHGERRLLRF